MKEQLQDLADGLIKTLNEAKGQILPELTSLPDDATQVDAAQAYKQL